MQDLLFAGSTNGWNRGWNEIEDKRLYAGSNGGSKRRIKPQKQKSSEPSDQSADPGEHVSHSRHANTGKALEYQLIDLMSEPDIDDEVKKSIWALVQYLMSRKAKKQTTTATN